MSLQYPPKVSSQWTVEERINYIRWVARITLERIGRNDPAIPVVAKRPMECLWQCVWAVSDWPACKLEENRAALMKPYDPTLDYDGVLIPSDLIERLRREYCVVVDPRTLKEDLPANPPGG